jgi:vacuolar-type H+-ATPase catalytic subunit A/Vma1
MWKIVEITTWPIRKVYNYTKGINDLLQSPTIVGNVVKDRFQYISNVAGATTGSMGAAKGVVDAAEALVCNDGICFVVSCVGTAADSLQVLASFVPGPNATIIVTTPISWGCKMFVFCCKRSKLPWGGC